MKFTQLTDTLNYPKQYRTKLSDYHSRIIEYVCNHYKNNMRYKRNIVYAMNAFSYAVCNGDTISSNWNKDDPLANIPDIDSDSMDKFLKDSNLYIDLGRIEWDLVESIEESQMNVNPDNVEVIESKEHITTEKNKEETKEILENIEIEVGHEPQTEISKKQEEPASTIKSKKHTSKEDLYIQNPLVPRIDINNVYASGLDGADALVVYGTLPVIPTRQRDISITTDVSLFSDEDLMNLYPNCFIPTRSSVMYERINGIPYDEQLGCILPIEGFTEEQVRDNIIKYPHLYQIVKEVDGKIVPFYSTIENKNHELQQLAAIWEDLPNASKMPKTKEFIKEYSVRRYLLERDILNVDHKYKMFGELDPYLTLFTTPRDYMKFYGVDDVVELARQCVRSRVAYRFSRNPVIRRLSNV